MIAIENTLVSEELLSRKFVCDLNACKGACCVKGSSGAPIEEEEIRILENIYPIVKPYLTRAGVKTLEKLGFCVIDEDNDKTIPLVEGKKKYCSFVFFEKDGTAKCAIEKVHKEGKIKFKKPISCHLYPVRITKYPGYDAVNYQEWNVCKPACSCGEKLDVPVFRFLREPLIRRYGEPWFKEIERADELMQQKASQETKS